MDEDEDENDEPENFEQSENEEEGEEMEEEEIMDDDDDDADDDDDEDDVIYDAKTGYKRAQPVLHKKFASTGFLFHRFGGALAPIEEQPEEMAAAVATITPTTNTTTTASSVSSSPVSQTSEIMTSIMSNNVSVKGSTSCFSLIGDCLGPSTNTQLMVANNEEPISSTNKMPVFKSIEAQKLMAFNTCNSNNPTTITISNCNSYLNNRVTIINPSDSEIFTDGLETTSRSCKGLIYI